MKRHLKNERYRLDDRQAESLWYLVRRELVAGGGAPGGRRRRAHSWRPVVAVAAVLTVALVGALALRDGRVVAPTGSERMRATELSVPPPTAAAAKTPTVERVAPATDHATDPAAVVAMRAPAIVPPAGAARPATPRVPEPVPDDMAGPPSAAGRREQELRDALQAATAADLSAARQAVPGPAVRSRTFEKYAIGSVEEALSKQSGVVYRAGELYVRGGRSGEVSMQVDGVAAAPPGQAATGNLGGVSLRGSAPAPASPGVHYSALGVPPVPGESRAAPAPGSITGGTTPPNGETFESMYFKHAGVNPFVATDEDALSTFALDVDNASFTLARSYLDRGVMPPAEAIRVEEFVNAIDAGWPRQTGETFRIGIDGGPSRFGDGYQLLRIGIVGRSLDAGQRKPANLVFVVDVSGSMDRESRLGAVKRALRTLVDELDEGDRVGIVVYGSRGEVRLPLTDASRRGLILGAIDELRPGGSTNAAEGLQLGYRLARDGYERGLVNRLILCSDGVANTGGATDAEGILELARRGRDDGITLSTVGFGMGNYNDVLMEQLADKGDGNYFYVDRPQEAERVFRENLTGLLQTVARQAKVQVEFDPHRVARWRLLGYENRDVADRDFRNDAVDAGEVGAGHQVTALYEIKLTPDGRDLSEDDRLGAVRLRWEAPEHDTAHAGEVRETERPITGAVFHASVREDSPHRQAQALAAEFAEILRGSYWAKESRLADLVPLADDLARDLRDEPAVQDLREMIRRAAALEEHRPAPAGGDGER
jgi:Ca-activated chloride channel homolog